MTQPDFITEPILVQARFLADGQTQPTAFVWHGRQYTITDWGRQWDEAADGVTWRCYLVRTAARETFEIRLNRATGAWQLNRAWQKATLS